MMNIKLIIGSITGIGTLGGVVACCYYGFRREINTKQKNTPKPEATPSSEQSIPKTQNLENEPDVAPEDSSKLTTVPKEPQPAQRVSEATQVRQEAVLSPSN